MQTTVLSPNLSGCVSILDVGVTYLATYINERTDHTASIWDFTFNRRNWKDYLRQKFESERPEVIGITYTSMYQGYVEAAIECIREELSKEVKIIVGGVHPTLKPEDGINLKGVDAVVIGEGEPAFHEILDNIEGGKELDEVKGIWFRNQHGEVIKNQPRGWIADINELPWPNYDLWDDFDKYMFYLQQLWLMGTRGCPYLCTNCEEVQMYKLLPNSGDSPSGIKGTRKRFRFRDPESYAQEIAYHFEKYKNRGMRMAHPFDPVFPIQRQWTLDFVKHYINTGISPELPISIFARADSFYAQSPTKGTFDEERLVALKEANIKEVRVGVESGTERMRNEIHKKGVTNDQIRETFALCRKHGIQTIAYNMLGGPTETKKDMIETLRLNLQIKPNKPIFFVYQELTHDLEQMGLVEGSLKQDYKVPLKSANKLSRSDQDKGTIQFGEPMSSKHYSRQWLIAFQYFCYAYFIGKRVCIGLYRQKHRFVINFFRVMYQGYKDGVNMKIVFAYFLSATGDNLFT